MDDSFALAGNPPRSALTVRLKPTALTIAAALLLVAAVRGRGINAVAPDAARATPRDPQGDEGRHIQSAAHGARIFAAGSDGAEVTLARYRGKVVLLSFGFTHCAAVCPTTLATLAQARSSLGKAADSVQVIYVTVDPERDDAAHLRVHLAAFDRSFIGATGAPDALAAVREKYGVTAVRQGTGPDYAMAATLIDLHDRSRRQAAGADAVRARRRRLRARHQPSVGALAASMRRLGKPAAPAPDRDCAVGVGRARRAWVGALAPIAVVSHNQLFEIPRGTWRRHSGRAKDRHPLPHTIRLTLGINDVLVLKNADAVPHIFGRR